MGFFKEFFASQAIIWDGISMQLSISWCVDLNIFSLL